MLDLTAEFGQIDIYLFDQPQRLEATRASSRSGQRSIDFGALG